MTKVVGKGPVGTNSSVSTAVSEKNVDAMID